MNDDIIRDTMNSKSVRVAGTAVLAILAVFLLAQTINAMQNFGRPGTPATETITVTGTGEATMAPDVAHVSFTVEHTAATVAAAQQQTTKLTNDALALVKEKGIEDKDVKTLYYDTSPQYAYPQPCIAGAICPPVSSPKITGYRVAQTIQLTLHDLTAVGAVLEGLGKLNVQNVNGPAFALDDSTAGYNAARADAIAKAKAQAEELAEQLGVSLGDIVSFGESSGGYPYPMYAYGKGGAEDARSSANPPSLPTGQNTYTATVSITYEIR